VHFQRAAFSEIATEETAKIAKAEEGGADEILRESDRGRDDGEFQSVVQTQCLWKGLGPCMQKADAL